MKFSILSTLVVLLLLLSSCGVAVKGSADIDESGDTSVKDAAFEPQWAGWTLDRFLEESSCVYVGS
jgi:hypothetical protein